MKPCTEREARLRLAKARDFLDVADLALGDGKLDPATSDAILAGVAAADAICCARLKERSSSDDHAAAAQLLARVDRTAATALRRLLGIKFKAQYDDRPVTRQEARDAVERARRLVARAERLLLT